MAASAADIRSALSIPDASLSAGPSQTKKPLPPNARKPEGISRELYSLIGPSAPSLAAQLAKPRLKQKPNFGGRGGKTKWGLRSFVNAARHDHLELQHWEKISSDPPSEYPFAKYNVQPTTYTYSQDEYTRFLEDKEWTKEETDYLFSLVRDFDSRWYIIHDRYEYPEAPSRSLEDLKDRYYSVCRKLVRNRAWPGDEAGKAQLISSFQFDKERELTRKKYLLSLENRTPEQIAEEEALYIEIKRLEQHERKFKKEREALLRTLAGMDSGLPDIVEDDGGPLGITPDGKKRKKGAAMEIDSPATPSTSTAVVVKRQPSAKNAAYDAQHCIIRTDVPTTATATKAAHQPAYLRSFKLPTPKAAIAPKVTLALSELGISHSRLVIPTRENVAQFESLLDATTTLIETKRLIDKADYDIKVLRNRLGLREKSQSVDGETKVDNNDAMDVDYTQGDGDGDIEEGDDGRGQSVVSTKSGRSRKHVSGASNLLWSEV
ncbi:hypothetical protein BYT27DRAFT_7087203 [Phlegmacium glaucopus]|nr:hypothetical protein BYT27DRAFT_7087203 [Phlegmacium glaucopus]